MNNLKPCPFCGGEAKIADEHQWISGVNNGGISKYIYCLKCNCRTSSFYWDDRKTMIRTWNKRLDSEKEALE